MSDNLTEMLLAEPVYRPGAQVQEQPLTDGDVEATDTTGSSPVQSGKPSDSQAPADAGVQDGDASLNTDASDGNKTPTTVPYEKFAARNNELQSRIDAQERELEAVRLGFKSHEEYQFADLQAKNIVNPFTGTNFSGIKEYKAAESRILAEQEREKRITADNAAARQKYIEEFGEEYGGQLADVKAAADRARYDAEAVRREHAQTVVSSEISKLEAEYSQHLGTDWRMSDRLRTQLMNSHPQIAKEAIEGLRESIQPLVMTPEKKAQLQQEALRKYQAEKAADKARVGATPQTGGHGGRAVASDGKIDIAAVRKTSFSDLLGINSR